MSGRLLAPFPWAPESSRLTRVTSSAAAPLLVASTQRRAEAAKTANTARWPPLIVLNISRYPFFAGVGKVPPPWDLWMCTSISVWGGCYLSVNSKGLRHEYFYSIWVFSFNFCPSWVNRAIVRPRKVLWPPGVQRGFSYGGPRLPPPRMHPHPPTAIPPGRARVIHLCSPGIRLLLMDPERVPYGQRKESGAGCWRRLSCRTPARGGPSPALDGEGDQGREQGASPGQKPSSGARCSS